MEKAFARWRRKDDDFLHRSPFETDGGREPHYRDGNRSASLQHGPHSGRRRGKPRGGARLGQFADGRLRRAFRRGDGGRGPSRFAAHPGGVRRRSPEAGHGRAHLYGRPRSRRGRRRRAAGGNRSDARGRAVCRFGPRGRLDPPPRKRRGAGYGHRLARYAP